MTRTATLTFSRNGEAGEINLGQFVFQMKDDKEDRIPVSTLRADVSVPGSGEAVTFESACVEHTGNTSFAIFFAGEQILLVACRWEQLPPHIRVRLPVVDGWLGVYCKST